MAKENKSKMRVDYFQTPNMIFDNPELNLTPYEKLVYIYLCRCSNQGAEAYPGYMGIARKCGISKSTAKTAVGRLKDKGLIRVTKRPKANKDNLPNLYKVNHIPGSCDNPGGSGDNPGAGSGDDLAGSCGNPYKEPLKKNPSQKEPQNSIDQFFEKIWELYPRKVGKGRIKPAVKRKLYEIGFDTIEKCIERYRETKPDWQAWQHGNTFFNSGYIDYLDENFNKGEMEGDSYKTGRKDEEYYRQGAGRFFEN